MRDKEFKEALREAEFTFLSNCESCNKNRKNLNVFCKEMDGILDYYKDKNRHKESIRKEEIRKEFNKIWRKLNQLEDSKNEKLFKSL